MAPDAGQPDGATPGESAAGSRVHVAGPDGAALRHFLSPAVRRLGRDLGVDPTTLTGSGNDGRVTRDDVLRAAGSDGDAPARPEPRGMSRPAPEQVSRRTSPEASPRSSPDPWPGDEVIAFSPIRRATAEHLVTSLATAAHTLVVTEVDYEGVDRVRDALDRSVRLSYLPFIARAVIDAIHSFPHVNAVVGDDELVVRQPVNLGFAVDLDYEGLVVPVVRDADRLRLPALAARIRDVAARAREQRLIPRDVESGTFTITNAGGFGTLMTGPILNQPQVAILSTDGVKMRPAAVPDGDGGYALTIHPIGNLSLSFDHRAFDGAYASAFLALVRDTLEQRDWRQEL